MRSSKLSLSIAGSAAMLLAAPIVGHAATYSHSGNFCSTAPVDNVLSGGFNGNGFGSQAVGVNLGSGRWMSDFTQSGPPDNPQGFDYLPDATSTGAGANPRPGISGSNIFSETGGGLASSYSITWSAEVQDDNEGGRPNVANRHGQMMAGFLQSNTTSITLTSSGIADLLLAADLDEYSVTLYIDGEDAKSEVGEWEVTEANSGVTYYGVDDSDFLNTAQTIGDFVQVTSTVAGVYQSGNYVTFSGLTTDFDITLTGTSDGIVLNAFDVTIPVPGTLALLGFGLLIPGAAMRRFRKAA